MAAGGGGAEAMTMGPAPAGRPASACTTGGTGAGVAAGRAAGAFREDRPERGGGEGSGAVATMMGARRAVGVGAGVDSSKEAPVQPSTAVR